MCSSDLDRVDAIRKAFALPDRYVPFAAVPVGYPKKPLCPQDRFDETRIRWVR